MNTRQEWLNNTDYTSQFYSAEETINEVKENFDIRRYYSAEGADVIVDGIECRALVQYFTNPLNQAKYDRKLHIPMETNISTGSIIDYDGYKWLVTGSIDDIQAYKTACMVKSNNTLTIHKNNTLYQIPCIISKSLSLNTEDNQYIETVDNSLYLTVSNSLTTQQIKVNDIYEIGTYNYYISSVADDISNPGLLVFKMKYSEVVQESHVYTIEILNGTIIDVQESTTLQLNVNVYDNGQFISPAPSLLFVSSDETVCNVDENGLITANSIGSCVVSVSLVSDNSVSNNININVIAVPQNNYTYSLTSTSLPDTEIIITQIKQYEIKKYNNGILIEQNFTFNVIGDSSGYQLTVIDGNNCSVKALKSGAFITLQAVDNSNNEIMSKEIKLKNLF